MAINEDRLNGLVMKMVGELGVLASLPSVLLGDRLGLYKAMQGAGAMSADDLAERTGVRPRYALEWLNAQAASGFIDYDEANDRYTLSDEAAMVFADEDSPACMLGGIELLASPFHDLDKLQRAYTSQSGLGWHEHHPSLFSGTERFFRAGYNANLVANWLPALDGVTDKLQRGAKVADVGCGLGASTILMAKAFPKSSFVGFDYHDGSIEKARSRAADAGVGDRVRFEISGAKNFPGDGYDLVTFFDCLHDMGDPVGAARHVRSTLAGDGTWMIVEPMANDRVKDNLNPVGRLYYSASSVICTPCSLSQEVGLGLGAQAGEKRLRDVITEGGFARVRRATETPFNMVLEARAN